MTPIPTPGFSAETVPEQLYELRKALCQLIGELNMILPMLEKGEREG